MFFRKKVKPGHEHDPRIQKIDGLHYYETLKALLQKLDPEWYLEIGSRNGRSLSQCKTNYIAIDPEFALQYEVVNKASQMLFFQQTSDDFFASDFLTRNSIQPGVAFIDGMHLFEYVLRDFMNCERHMKSEAFICLHDVCPYNTPQTTRDISYMTQLKRPWTGDVWKMLIVLQKYRPDLQVNTLKAATTGFACVTGLDAKSQVLQDNYADILAEYTNLTFEAYGPEKYYGSFELKDPETFLARL
jgi:hypothetical protein